MTAFKDHWKLYNIQFRRHENNMFKKLKDETRKNEFR